MKPTNRLVSRADREGVMVLRRRVRQIAREEFPAMFPSTDGSLEMWFECSEGGWFRRVIRASVSRLHLVKLPTEVPATPQIRREVEASIGNPQLRLVQAVEEANAQALDHLCELTGEALSCTREAALDHVATLFGRRSLSNFDGRGDLSAWIYATRPRSRSTPAAEPCDPGLLDRIEADERPVWRRVSDNWERTALCRALLELPRDEARLVLLREALGMSYADIADDLELSHYETARRRVSNSLQKLRTKLAIWPEAARHATSLGEVLRQLLPD